MKIKLDENLGDRGAELFRAAGHDVATAGEQNLTSSTDEVLISVCKVEGRCLVTMDLDFGNPFLFHPWQYPGIAVLRLPSKPTDLDLWDACRTLVNGLEKSDITGKLWIVQRARIREYQPETEQEES